MQVITLNPDEFASHAARLAAAVREGSPISFDAIVGVRRGGSIVCDEFLRHFPRERYSARYDVTLQRPSSKRKEGRIGRILRQLPYPMLDAMRMAESIFLSLRRATTKRSYTADVKLPEGLPDALRKTECPEILVIDDAIDSGDTLLAIKETLRKKNPEARITIAVLTETTRHPRIRSNYTLYRNRTLIRFPWSNDYKANSKERHS